MMSLLTQRRRAIILAAGLGAIAARVRASVLPGDSRSLPLTFTDDARDKRQRYCAENSVPGALVGSVNATGQQRIERVVGSLPAPFSSPPMAADIAYPIGSVGKLALGALVLRTLEDQGIELDTPVVRYLPDSPWQDAISSDVSFRHLGQHTSGLAEPIANQAFQAAIVADPARRLTALETLAAALQQPRRHAPGERYSYSNANSVLLAKAIEGIRKQMLQAMMRDPPMSLAGNESPFVYPASDQWRASGLRAFRHAREGRPIGYGTLLTDVTMFSPSWASAGGDWSARISDLLAFGRFLLASALLNPSWFAQLSGTHAASRNGDRGYGFHCMRHGDWFGHTGDVPGFSAALWIRPQRGDCMAALSNLSNTRAGKNPADELLWLL